MYLIDDRCFSYDINLWFVYLKYMLATHVTFIKSHRKSSSRFGQVVRVDSSVMFFSFPNISIIKIIINFIFWFWSVWLTLHSVYWNRLTLKCNANQFWVKWPWNIPVNVNTPISFGMIDDQLSKAHREAINPVRRDQQ